MSKKENNPHDDSIITHWRPRHHRVSQVLLNPVTSIGADISISLNRQAGLPAVLWLVINFL